jgi:hypothetical protein
MCKPYILKIFKAIAKLETNVYENNMKELPYGGSNPYYYCSECNRSMIEVSYKGHYDNCRFDAITKKIKNLRHESQIELKKFLEKEDYLTKSFKHYLWFKQGIHVEGLHILEQAIIDYEKNKTKHQKESKEFNKFIKSGSIN